VTHLRPQTRSASAVQPSRFSGPYWDGCAVGELRFQRCGDCSAATHTPATVCARCQGTKLSWEVGSGRGVIHSFTVVHRPVSPDFDCPYAPVLVEMEEGWTMLSSLIGCDHSEVTVGLEVQVGFHAGADGVALPYMRPRT
jgi:uncharacterized OB-fold protein